MGSKHGFDGMITDSFLNHHGHYGGKIANKQSLSGLHEDDGLSPKTVQRSEHSKFKASISARNHCVAPEMEEKRISVMVTQVFTFVCQYEITLLLKVLSFKFFG